MAIEVLRPQSCLVDRIRESSAVFNRRRNNHRKPPSGPDQSRRSSSNESKLEKFVSGEMGMEKVTILRRRESLDSKIKREKSPSSNENRGFGAQKHTETMTPIDDIYAGSATFAGSPSPSSLPLPSFSRKKKSQVVPIDDSATRDLRRLLRLEL